MAFQLTPLHIPSLTTDYSAQTNATARLGELLGNLPGDMQKQRLAQQKQQILGQIGTGNLDYEKAGRSLIALGDTQAGATLLGLGQKQQERDLEKAWMNGGAGLGAAPSQPLGAAPAASAKMPPSEIKAIIDANVPEADREYAYRMAQKESSFNPGAVSPTGAKGLFQFTGGTGRQYGLVDRAGDIRDNPTANTQAFARFTEDNRQALRQALGRDPTYGELALAHQQGAGGAIALITGKGDVNPNNLRVNNADPNAPRSESARRIMAYYGYGNEQPAPNQTSRQPAQVAQANVPGDDPVKLRSDAQYYAQSNPEAARQLNARADALEQSRGTQVAQAAPQPGQPVADAPASGAKEAQFVLPGTGEVIPQAISTDPAVRSAMGRYVTAPTERTRTVAKQALDLAVADAKQRQAINQPTDETKNFEQYRREELAAGRPAPTRADYLAMKRTQINNTNTFDGKGESKFNEALGAAQAKRWNGYIEEGDAAQGRLADIQTLRETSRRLGSQGSSANLKALIGPYAESLGIKVDGLSDIQLYESITNRLAPTLRAPGSGSTSDIEFKGFLKGIGPLSNTPAAREMILDTYEAASRNDVARSEIASRLASGEINRGQAEKELRALPDPMTSFKEFRKQYPDLVGQAIKESARIDSQQRAAPSITTAEGYNALKPGDKYTDPQGNIRTKR